MSRRVLTACLLAFLAACAAAACRERPQTRFPHELHLAHVECGAPGRPRCVSCTSCHQPEPGDVEPSHAPDVARCVDCHPGDSSERLLAASRGHAERGPERVRFSHARHLSMPEIAGQCVGCHAGAFDDDVELFPPMSRCVDCHRHREQFVQGRCTPCHEAPNLRRLVPRSFMRHDASWLAHHGVEARGAELACLTCHEQSECADCHDVTQTLSIERRRPDAIHAGFVHRGDFLSRHAIEAAMSPKRCVTCHAPESCDACHVQRGVSASAKGGRSPHPMGWLGDPGSARFHGRAARRDPLSCAGCHERGPATNCIDCHRVGGHGGNPHPRNFRSQQSLGSVPCRHCHVP